MLPGSPFTVIPPKLPLITVATSADVTFDVFAAAGSPAGRVVLALWVPEYVVRGSASVGLPGLSIDGFTTDSVVYLINAGHITAKGGDGGAHNQIPRAVSLSTGNQHCPGGPGGAGSPGGTGGLGSPGSTGFNTNVDPAGPDGNDGTLTAGGAGQEPSSQAYHPAVEADWSDDRDGTDDPDFSAEDGSPAITLNCQLKIYNFGFIFGSGGGGAAGFYSLTTPKAGSPNGGDPGEKPSYASAGNWITAEAFEYAAEVSQSDYGRFLAGKNGEAGAAIVYSDPAALATFVVGGVDGVDVKGAVG